MVAFEGYFQNMWKLEKTKNCYIIVVALSIIICLFTVRKGFFFVQRDKETINVSLEKGRLLFAEEFLRHLFSSPLPQPQLYRQIGAEKKHQVDYL